MQIRMTLDRIEPPAGTVQRLANAHSDVQEGTQIAFTGWLGMLQAPSELIGSPRDYSTGGE